MLAPNASRPTAPPPRSLLSPQDGPAGAGTSDKPRAVGPSTLEGKRKKKKKVGRYDLQQNGFTFGVFYTYFYFLPGCESQHLVHIFMVQLPKCLSCDFEFCFKN